MGAAQSTEKLVTLKSGRTRVLVASLPHGRLRKTPFYLQSAIDFYDFDRQRENNVKMQTQKNQPVSKAATMIAPEGASTPVKPINDSTGRATCQIRSRVQIPMCALKKKINKPNAVTREAHDIPDINSRDRKLINAFLAHPVKECRHSDLPQDRSETRVRNL